MKFYYLETLPKDPYRSSAVEVYDLEHKNKGPAPKCGVCGAYIGPYQYLPPFLVELELEAGVTQYGDLIDYSGDALLVSDKFKNLWEREDLIGLSGFHEIKIKRIKGIRRAKEACPQYYHVSVARSRAAIDAKASVLIRDGSKPICPECRTGGIIKRMARIVLEPNTWSGEDIFIARGLPGTVLVTERFKEFSDGHRFKNVLLIDAKDYSFDFYKAEN
jgi:hypothetical protein